MQKRSAILAILLFGAALIAVPLYWLFAPKESFSPSERRYLAELPKLSAQRLTDWSFDDAIETYLADHLPLRDVLVGVHAYATLLSGRQVTEEVWTDGEGYLVEAPIAPEADGVQKRMRRMDALAESTGVRAYLIAVPSTGYIRSEHLDGARAALYDDEALLGTLATMEHVAFVPLAERFRQEGQAWYYRTDHHWTADGAYAAYEAFLSAAGHDAVPHDGFYHHTVSGYYGSTRSRAALWLTAPDTMQIDEPIDARVRVTFSDDDGVYDSLFFYDHLGEYDWYPLFLDGNHPVTVIENEAAPMDAPTILMVKDSFGNTLAPLLVPTYRRVILVDPRYYKGSVAALCAEYGADELLFCYSIERVTTDLNLLLLK